MDWATWAIKHLHNDRFANSFCSSACDSLHLKVIAFSGGVNIPLKPLVDGCLARKRLNAGDFGVHRFLQVFMTGGNFAYLHLKPDGLAGQLVIQVLLGDVKFLTCVRKFLIIRGVARHKRVVCQLQIDDAILKNSQWD